MTTPTMPGVSSSPSWPSEFPPSLSILSSHPQTPFGPVSLQHQIKLPRLTLKRFNGNVTKWIAFWDLFNSAVHSNPSLSNVDKFTYLHSLLDTSADKAIAGLTLSSANYEEAVATLKQRFGNPQLIIDKHMNSTESNVRGLRALESFGSLLTSILMDKLPSEIRIIISRELTKEKWSMEDVMRIVSCEVTACEQSAASSSNPLHHPKKHSQWSLPH